MSGELSLIYTTSDSLYTRTKTMLSYKLVLNKFHYQVLVILAEVFRYIDKMIFWFHIVLENNDPKYKNIFYDRRIRNFSIA